MPPAGMDPQASDPNVLFVHPPFTTFPDSHMYPDGLTYPIMAENPEWFLDANDFVSQNNPNPNAIPYPPHLEPPRGWCPAKKKDLRDRGSDGWPEGEEPRLRCTFCRRTYAGVNAKSMWRRHVFEKHKIAMSNRRDGNERPRGRGSNSVYLSENVFVQPSNSSSAEENGSVGPGKVRDEAHDKLVSMEVTPQTDPLNVSHKSRFRSLLPTEETRRHHDRSKVKVNQAGTSAPRIPQSEFPAFADDVYMSHADSASQSDAPPISPPLTPPYSSDPLNSSVESSDGPAPASPPPSRPVVPPSPYDPLLTPSFRHSPARLPSDQPWRFPSPSHPLHSRARELSLSMLVRDFNSPTAKGPLMIDGSPRVITVSPFSSSRSKLNFPELDTPESLGKPRPSPRALFSRGRLPIPSSDRTRLDKGKYRIEESPLGRSLRSNNRSHKRTVSELTDDWLTEGSLSSSTALALEGSGLLTSHDPFSSMYATWTPISPSKDVKLPKRDISRPGESPVLRSKLPAGVGLGIGLLEPFALPGVESRTVHPDSDSDGMLMYPPLTEEEGDEAEAVDALAVPTTDKADRESHVVTPPLKKRRMTK